MSSIIAVRPTFVQDLLELNRGLYVGHVLGRCPHPLVYIVGITAGHEEVTWINALGKEALEALKNIRRCYFESNRIETARYVTEYNNVCELLSEQILDFLEDFLPPATVSYQRELTEQYQSILKKPFVDVSAYMWSIKHGEDFVVCLRRIAFETLYSSVCFKLHQSVNMVELKHQKFLRMKQNRDVSFMEKITMMRDLDAAKSNMLMELTKNGF